MIARWFSLAAVGICLMCCAPAPAQEKSKADKHSTSDGESAPKVDGKGRSDDHVAPEIEGSNTEQLTKSEKHAGEEHHDPHDLSHANASHDLTAPQAIKSDAAIFTVVIFLLLLLILIKFAWKPIAHGLELREKGIADKIEQARLAAEQATAQLQQYEAKLAAATAEAQQIVAQARQDAEAAGQKLIAEAQSAAAKERERAVADIGAAKNQALQEIAERSVDTAVTLARNIIRREVRPADHEQLIQDALKQFPAANMN